MKEEIINLLKRGDEEALEIIIKTYTGYVATVIINQLGGLYNLSTVEELTSDVFFELWRSRLKLKSTRLRGWLGTTARNKTKNYMRSQKIICEELDEDCIAVSECNLFDRLDEQEQNDVINAALSEMKPQEKEIIIRYYFYNQTLRQISEETETNLETAKSRLKRSREKFKKNLENGGYFSCEEI